MGRSLSPQELKMNVCSGNVIVQIERSNDKDKKTRVSFSHLSTTFIAEGVFKRGKPIDIADLQESNDIPETSSERYLFLRNLSGYAVKENELWRFMGYNQDWIGCPQSLCLDAHLDAASELGSEVIFFSGAFFWRTKNKDPDRPLTDIGIEIKGVKYLDAAYCFVTCYLIKDGSLYRANSETDFSPSTVVQSPGNPCVNEAVRAATKTEGRIVVFLETHYCNTLRENPSLPAVTEVLPQDWHDLDAVFSRNDQMYLIRRWMYFKVTAKEDEAKLYLNREDGQQYAVLSHLFGCDDNFYSSLNLGTKEEYQSKMSTLVDGLPKDDWKTYGIVEPKADSETESGSNILKIMFIVVGLLFLLALIIIVVVVAVWFLSRKSTKKVGHTKKLPRKVGSTSSTDGTLGLKLSAASKTDSDIGAKSQFLQRSKSEFERQRSEMRNKNKPSEKRKRSVSRR